MTKSKKSVQIGNSELTFETGQVARQAGGSVIVRSGDTVVFSSACRSDNPKDDCDFLPLMVRYEEKFSSKGKTLGGFIKREGRPTEKETLTSRLIDRPIRPLFPKGYHNEVQVVSTVWSYDGVNSPDILGLCAASAALVLSDIPLSKPVGGVRVGQIDGEFVVNPTVKQQEESKLDLLLAGTEDAILMIEGYCDFLTEDEVIAAIEAGHVEIRKICQVQKEWAAEIGKAKNTDGIRVAPEGLAEEVEAIAKADVAEAIKVADKGARGDLLDAAKEKVKAQLLPEDGEPKYLKQDVMAAFKSLTAQLMRERVLSEGVRVDGRSPTDVRNIDIEQTFLPRVHGSSLFTRGETQAMVVCTLGGESMAQRFETLDEEGAHRFYLQYFFPPYSVGEAGRMGPPGRREVGHGKLAEKALRVTLPSKEEFPYVIRVESNITESNGSSSMASVCGGCLAMMNAGVPIKKPVSGVAMGLILEGDKYVVLTDILGLEDALGDMDFKITGDKDGITAFQMDIKVEGITHEIMAAALKQARQGRIHILEKMLEACPETNKEMSKYAPRIETVKVHPSKIGGVIGPGGKQIRAIIEQTGVAIDIDDDGSISIASDSLEGIEEAKAIIHGLTAEVEIGRKYRGKITSVVPFGCFVELLPGKEGLCHISELDNSRVEDINALFKQGDMMDVKVLDINERGQVKLSRKATLSELEPSS